MAKAKPKDEVVEDAPIEVAEAVIEETASVVEEVVVAPAQPEVVDPQPCCLPQHDPSLRSPRTTEQAAEMIKVIQQNS